MPHRRKKVTKFSNVLSMLTSPGPLICVFDRIIVTEKKIIHANLPSSRPSAAGRHSINVSHRPKVERTTVSEGSHRG